MDDDKAGMVQNISASSNPTGSKGVKANPSGSAAPAEVPPTGSSPAS
jgi:hypothetical protein